MDQLTVSLLGSFALLRNREPVTDFESNKVRALLIYLAVEQGRHARTALATFLWPGYAVSNARVNLRQVLYQLRRTLGDEQADPSWLLIDRQMIGLNPAAAWRVDVSIFRELLAATATHPHQTLAGCELCLERLRQAVDLYRNDFLTGFALDDSATFEEWRRFTQEQIFLQAFDALRQLTAAAVARGDDAAVLRYAQRQLALEPWREEAHRQLMAAYWRRGQRSVALAQYESCCQILADELGTAPDEETTAFYERIRAGAPSAAELLEDAPQGREPQTIQGLIPLLAVTVATGTWSPAVTAQELSRRETQVETADRTDPAQSVGQLPTPLTPFVGRSTELATVMALLQRSDVRITTLLGPGGIGKTRLAQQVGQIYGATVTDKVFYVALAGITAPTALASVLAAALGLSQPGVDARSALARFLHGQHVLLILDNLEHLLPATPLLADLLQGAPPLKLLITSRERLNIPGEQLFVVEGMGYPKGGMEVGDAVAPLLNGKDAMWAHTNPAIALFCQCAQRVAPIFQLTPETLPTVIRICQLVQGMPLALEMAAAWLEVLPLPTIADEITQSADFLEAQWRGVPARQQSMRAVFNWSWHLLNQAEQQAFRRLAIFQGSFTRVAALAVGQVNLRTLAALVHKSLLQFTYQEAEYGQYQMHELLRQFAAEQLESAGEAMDIGLAHSDYYLRFVAEQVQQFGDEASGDAVTHIRQALENIEQAWRWAADHAHIELLTLGVYALGEFYVTTGLAAQGVQSFRYAHRVLFEAPLTLTNEPTTQQAALLRGTLLASQAQFLVSQGLYNEAFVLIEATLPLSCTTGNYWAEALCRLLRAIITIRRGEPAAGQAQLADNLALVNNHRALREAVMDAYTL